MYRLFQARFQPPFQRLFQAPFQGLFAAPRRYAGYGLLAGALALGGCLESATPDLVPRQPTLVLNFPVGDSAVGLTYLPVALTGRAASYAGLRSLRLFVSRDGAPETLYRDLTPAPNTTAAPIETSYLPSGARRALIRAELVDVYGYRLERTLRVRFITGLPLTLGLPDSVPALPAKLVRGGTTVIPLHVLSQGELRELRVYEQIGQSAPRLLRTVAGSAFTHPNGVPVLWNFAYPYVAPTGVRPRQEVLVRFDLTSVSGLTATYSYPYLLTP